MMTIRVSSFSLRFASCQTEVQTHTSFNHHFLITDSLAARRLRRLDPAVITRRPDGVS